MTFLHKVGVHGKIWVQKSALHQQARVNPNRGIYLRILLYNSSVKINMSTGKVKRALFTLAEIRSLLPQLVSDLTCGQKKWQKRAEVVVNLKYELNLHPSI